MKKLLISYWSITLAILILAVMFGSSTTTSASITDYGVLSTTLNEPVNSIIPAMRQIGNSIYPYHAGERITSTVLIHNETDTVAQWQISYTDVSKPSYYWIGDGIRMVDDYGNYVTCYPPPASIEQWITIHEPLSSALPDETKEISITLNVPKNTELPDIWEFRLHYENLSQSGNVRCAYDQIWQIYTERR